MFISQKSINFAHVIELERHIEILLLSNDCVIVPDLGGFMAHHVEAYYDERDHTFLPPLRTLGFNPQLKMNDSLLVQSYVEAYDLSYPEALRRIEDEVIELKQHLENEGSYELNDIGLLSINEDGRIIFTPCEAGILTPNLYGLSSFEMKRLSIKHETLPVEQPSVVPIENTTVEQKAEETQESVEELFAEESEEERAIVIKMSWVRNAVAVAAAILAFFIMTTPVSNSNGTNKNMSNLNNLILVSMQPKDTSMKKITITKPEQAQTAIKSDTLQSQKVVEEEKTNLESYSIVLASYITKKNANAFVEDLHKKGFSEAEVFIRNNVTRVIFGSFKTENEAYNKLRTLRGEKNFEEAWVMKI